jgi:hypothetical protein
MSMPGAAVQGVPEPFAGATSTSSPLVRITEAFAVSLFALTKGRTLIPNGTFKAYIT